MSDSLVTVRTFRFPVEADTCRALLESEGITCFVHDDAVVTADWFLGNAVGYVKLCVPEEQAERALDLLERIPEYRKSDMPDDAPESYVCLSCDAPMAEGVDRCPECGWSYADEEVDVVEDDAEE